MNEVFSIFLDNRAEAQTGGPHGYWLSLPTTAEQVQEALKEIHITADKPAGLVHWRLFHPGGKTAGTAGGFNQSRQRGRTELPCCPASKADAVELAELNAAMQSPAKMQTIGQLLDYAETPIVLS